MNDFLFTQAHLIVLPILLPLAAAALLLPLSETRHRLKYAINLGATLLTFLAAVALFAASAGETWPHGVGVYLAANWSAPFGIALLVDRLAALMLLLAACVALAALVFSAERWSRIGVHFHALFQLLLMGVNGAFLTNDFFNLFVFFEVMLAASYGLLLHGYNLTRIRAGMQYVTVNLVASFLFLIGVALIYASTGSLNMSDVGARLAGLDPAALTLFKAGAATLALAFLTKAAMWPLAFWLPTTYAAASPPVAAMLALMTKVGIYALLRSSSFTVLADASDLAGFGLPVLLWSGLLTLAFGTVGILASEQPGRIAGYAAIISSGTLLAVIGYGEPTLLGAGLFYLLGSTLGIAAFVLLIELIERIRSPGAAVLALTIEAFAIDEKPEEPVGVGIPAALAFLGLAFGGCAMVITGMPPLSGFIAKFSLFHALLAGGRSDPAVWLTFGLVVFSGLAGIISLMRFGVRTFWASGATLPPRLRFSEALPVSALIALCVFLTVQAGPAMDYLQRTADDLFQPGRYAGRVLGGSGLATELTTDLADLAGSAEAAAHLWSAE